MILQHLITFCRVVETGGFARAGALVGLSQPAVTRQVAALEADLGAPLLDRSSRQFHLTPAGEMVYERARRLAQSVEELREAVEDLTHPERGRIAIGAVTTVGLGLLPPILSEFTREYPGVRLQVKAGRTQETLARLLEAEIEMAVVPTPVTHPRLRSIPLRKDRVVLVCAPEKRETLPDPLPLEMLGQIDMISFQAPSRFRTFVDAILEQHGVYPNVTMEFDSHEAVRMMVEAGFGVAMVPESAVGQDLESGRVVEVKVQGLPVIARTTSLVVRKETDAWHPAAHQLCKMILQHFGVEA
ncbi:MAG: LysR family transcriptional regulator [Bacillota bacterium]